MGEAMGISQRSFLVKPPRNYLYGSCLQHHKNFNTKVNFNAQTIRDTISSLLNVLGLEVTLTRVISFTLIRLLEFNNRCCSLHGSYWLHSR